MTKEVIYPFVYTYIIFTFGLFMGQLSTEKNWKDKIHKMLGFTAGTLTMMAILKIFVKLFPW